MRATMCSRSGRTASIQDDYHHGEPGRDLWLGFLDLKDGPIVFEAAPQMQGLLDDFWHRPLTDIGQAGPDQGKGGKYLLLAARLRR